MTSTEEFESTQLLFSIPFEPDRPEDCDDLFRLASEWAGMRGTSLTPYELAVALVVLTKLGRLDSLAREMHASAPAGSQKLSSLRLELLNRAYSLVLRICLDSPVVMEDDDLQENLRFIGSLVIQEPSCHRSEEGTSISVQIYLING